MAPIPETRSSTRLDGIAAKMASAKQRRRSDREQNRTYKTLYLQDYRSSCLGSGATAVWHKVRVLDFEPVLL